MTRITESTVDGALDRGAIVFNVRGTEALRLDGSGTVGGGTIRGERGGSFSVTSASAATAEGGSVSGLSAFTIPHGLGTTPTLFNVTPANSQAALVPLLGYYVTADATNLTLSTVAAITAAKPYTWQWQAAP